MDGTAGTPTAASRRTFLRSIAASGGVAVGSGTAVAAPPRGVEREAAHDRRRDTGAELGGADRFVATLADDESIPGHEVTGSDGNGVARFRRRDGVLEFQLVVTDLAGDVVAATLHSTGTTTGPRTVELFSIADGRGVVTDDEPRDGDVAQITGRIEPDHVDPGDGETGPRDVNALGRHLENDDGGDEGRDGIDDAPSAGGDGRAAAHVTRAQVEASQPGSDSPPSDEPDRRPVVSVRSSHAPAGEIAGVVEPGRGPAPR